MFSIYLAKASQIFKKLRNSSSLKIQLTKLFFLVSCYLEVMFNRTFSSIIELLRYICTLQLHFDP